MNIPETVKILGITYKVLIVDSIKEAIVSYETDITDNDTTVGYISCKHATTWIQGGIPKEMQESIFLHEVIEAINDSLALKLHHDNIDRLDSALYQVINDNKEIFKES